MRTIIMVACGLMMLGLIFVLTGCGRYGDKLLNREPEKQVQYSPDPAPVLQVVDIPASEIADVNRRIMLNRAFLTARDVAIMVFVEGQSEPVELPYINRQSWVVSNYVVDRSMVSVFNVKTAIPGAEKIRIQYLPLP